jgi:hypothetical protein
MVAGGDITTGGGGETMAGAGAGFAVVSCLGAGHSSLAGGTAGAGGGAGVRTS